jgi:outer membrane lipoprotein SlyB
LNAKQFEELTMHDFMALSLKRTLVCSALVLAGCASTPSARPVLYPNITLQRVGETQARAQADACMARAASAGLSPYENNNAVAQGAGMGAATGGVAAAVGALITGRSGDSVLRAGAVQGAFHRDRPNMVYRSFVQRCLAEKGFDVIGWN